MALSHFSEKQCWGPAYPMRLRRGLRAPHFSSSRAAGSVRQLPSIPSRLLFQVLAQPEIICAEAFHPSPADVGSGKTSMMVKSQLTLTEHLLGANE